MLKIATVRFTGKVQKVFFRCICKRIADDMNLKGWIQNNKDGSVTLVLNSFYTQTMEFLTLIYKEYAYNIQKIEMEIISASDFIYNDFEIKY